MQPSIQAEIARSVRDFALPRYDQIPDTGLYLEQTARYISPYLSALGQAGLTGSMISNYVKQKLISSPVKKRYNRDQIARLIFIALIKSVLSIEEIQLLLRLQQRTHSIQTAYAYFCMEFENVLLYTLGAKDALEELGSESSDERTLLRNAIVAVAHKVYLKKYCQALEVRLAEGERSPGAPSVEAQSE